MYAVGWNRLPFAIVNRQLSIVNDMNQELRPIVHRPVLVKGVIELLRPQSGHTIVDCTLGTGGHSAAILPHLLPGGRLIGVDQDAQALERARPRLREFEPQVRYLHGNFRDLPQLLANQRWLPVDGLLADQGLSSLHVEMPERGFSFLEEGPLDMRMDQRQDTTAASLIARLSERELAELVWRYGEERLSRRIAKRIVMTRRLMPIQTTTQLARVIADASPRRGEAHRLHPATRTFQALRIAVNDELGSLEALLKALPMLVRPGGRVVLIAFHSLEDRLIKQAFRRGAEEGWCRVLTKKPVRPSEAEVEANPRARSAKLRAIERIG